MANRIKIARGTQNKLPTALAPDTLLYGELFWAKEEASVSDGVLYMGHPDGVEDGTNDKNPLPVAGARAMKSLYFEGLFDPSAGTYPTHPVVGSFWICSADGTSYTSTFHYGDWMICIAVNQDGSTQWIKSINQAITTQDPIALEKNPLDLTAGVIKLKYDGATLDVTTDGKLTLRTYEAYNLASGVTIANYLVAALDAAGNAIIADHSAEATSGVVGFAIKTVSGVVDVQKEGRLTNSAWAFADIGGPVYLGLAGDLFQDISTITPSGNIIIQVGTAVAIDTIEINIGTPFTLSLPSDLAYIPLTRFITQGDVSHAPTSDAVYNLISGSSSPSYSNIIPSQDNVYDVGSPDYRFANIYANELHVGEHSVYIGDQELVDDSTLGFSIINSSLPTNQQVPHKVITSPDLESFPTTGLVGFGTGDVSVVAALNSLQSKAVYTDVTSINGIALNLDSGSNLSYGVSFTHLTSGNYNTGIGIDALVNVTNGTSNTALGYHSMFAAASATGNVAVGSSALLALISGNYNAAMGDSALSGLTTGSRNTGVGKGSGAGITTGSSNTLLGYSTGNSLVDGSNNIVIGDSADVSASNVNNEITLGNSAVSALRIGSTTIWTSSNGLILAGPVGIDFIPDANNSRNLGSTTKRFADVYSVKGNFSSDVGVGGNLTVTGNLTVNGTTTQVNTTQVNIADNLIQINSNQVGAPSPTLVGGLEINRGDSTNYDLVFVEDKEAFQIGQVGSLQSVATREDTPQSTGIPFWNASVNRFDTDTALYFNNTTKTVYATAFVGALTGNASSATKLATSRTVAITGAVTGSASFDGTGNISISSTIAAGLTAGATTIGFVNYDGTTQAAGQFDGGTVDPSDTTRLNYNGNFYVNKLNAITSVITPLIQNTSASTNSVLLLENVSGSAVSALTLKASSGGVLIKGATKVTLQDQNLISPIPLSESGCTGLTGFTATSLVAALNELKGTVVTGMTAGSAIVGFINYNGTTQTAGQLDGGSTAPSHTARLNYDGNLYVNQLNATGSVYAAYVNSNTIQPSSGPTLNVVSNSGTTDAVVRLYNASGTGAGAILLQVQSGGITINAGTDLTFKDSRNTTGITLTQSGTTGLTNFTATSILGAINELKASPVVATTTSAGAVIVGQGFNVTSGKISLEPRLDEGRLITGIIIPAYVYPTNIFSGDTVYHNLAALAKQYHNVPMIVIVNPSNGPGTVVDGNYTGAIQLLQGAGIKVFGYVHATLASRAIASVVTDVNNWATLYPTIDGIWVDEFPAGASSTTASDTSVSETNLQYIQKIRAAAQANNIQWVFGNQGAPSSYTGVAYVQAGAIDKVCIWENSAAPAATDLGSTGDWVPSFETSDFSQRIAIAHSQASFNLATVLTMAQYTSYFYYTDSTTPYSAISTYLSTILPYLGSNIATASVPGVVKIGTGVSIAADGTISTAAAQTAGSATVGFVDYNGTTQATGHFDGGTTAPVHTTRLNYDGDLYVTDLFLPTNTTYASAGGLSFAPVGSGDVARMYGLLNSGATEIHVNVAADADDAFIIESGATTKTALFKVDGGGTVTIPGNLIVSGTTTTVSSTNVNFANTYEILKYAAVGADGDGGIQVRRAKATTEGDRDVKIYWSDASHRWTAVYGDNAFTTSQITTAADAGASGAAVTLVAYSGAQVAGQFDGSSTAPAHTTRLNYDGNFYATNFYGNGANLTSLTAANLTGTTLPTSIVTSSLTTVGVIGAGTWQGALIGPGYGGTGVNNGGRTLTINTNSGTISFTGASTTLTVAAAASVSGTNTGDQTSVSGNAGTVTNNDYNASANGNANAYGIAWMSGNSLYTTTNKLYFVNSTGTLTATVVANAQWNDIADCIEVPDELEIKEGRVYVMNDDGTYNPSTKYLDDGIMGIASDTYGFKVGAKEGKNELPIAIGGFVLAYVDQVYKVGTPLTAGSNGMLTEILLPDKKDYPEKIIATFWKTEPNDTWGNTENRSVDVNGRMWVKVR